MISNYLFVYRATRETVHRVAALRSCVIFLGFVFLHSSDIRADAWRRSHGGSTEIRRRYGFRQQPTVLFVFGSRTRSYRRSAYRRGREKWYLGGSPELSSCQEFHATVGEGDQTIYSLNFNTVNVWIERNSRGNRELSLLRFARASPRGPFIPTFDYG